MEQIFLHLPFNVILVVMLLGILYRVCSNARADDKIDAELEANKRRVGEAADRASGSSKGIAECKKEAERAGELADRARENQSAAIGKTESAGEIIKRARGRAEKIGGLAEICEEVLSNAKKKE